MAQDVWRDIITDAKIHGVEVPVSRRRISGGHDFGRHRFQGKAGQQTEPTGVHPLSFELEVPMFADMTAYPDVYPGTYVALLQVLRDPDLGGLVDYEDPELGAFQAQVVKWDVDETAERRGGAVVAISLEQSELDVAPLFIVQSGQSDSPGRGTIAAARVDFALAAQGVTDADVAQAFASVGAPLSGDELLTSPGQLFTQTVGSAVSEFQTTLVAFDRAAAVIATVRARGDVLGKILALGGIDSWVASTQAVVAVDSVVIAAREAISVRGAASVFRAGPGGVHARTVARVAYGDPERWQDVVAANSQPNPSRLTGDLRVFRPRRIGGSPGASR